MISFPEIGLIVGIAVVLFGCKAVSQNPFISRQQKILWMLTIVVLNWIGLLWDNHFLTSGDRKSVV